MEEKYFVKIEEIDNGPGYWNYLQVDIYQKIDGQELKIGSYVRRYGVLFNTFVPFAINGKDYALFSADYERTSVMELPSCRVIAEEELLGSGFCPVDFYVPEVEGHTVQFGFVAGCYWGDDTSWKIHYLDLSQIEQGIIQRDERFGYIKLPPSMDLKDVVLIDPDTDELNIILLTYESYFTNPQGKVMRWWNWQTGKMADPQNPRKESKRYPT